VQRPVVISLSALLLLGCSKTEKRKAHEDEPQPSHECATASDCTGATPCLLTDCVRGACTGTPSKAGTSCDDGDVCNGVSTCDGNGQCITGAVPVVDDSNPCTIDSCDPRSGPRHVPVAVDDSDVCTTDACNPATGEITHTPVDTDDGDDCTFDGCDPSSGPSHKRIEAFHTCDPSCGDGFHVGSTAENPRCGSAHAVETFCVPDCGPSFYACGTSCPTRYQKKAETQNAHCGAVTTQVFCAREP
jgi:hypothetical protein